MTGDTLARAINSAKGKISAPVLMGQDVAYIFVEKKDLASWAADCGQQETGMCLMRDGLGFVLTNED